MAIAGITRISGAITLLITIFSLSLPAYAKYSGGTGDPNDPYQIATAEDLMLLGESPEDYDKHFILTADIDLDPNLPGRKVFDRAVIAVDDDPGNTHSFFWGIPFTGVIDGNHHTISHLTITGENCLGLFGGLRPPAKVSNIGLIEVNIQSATGVLIGGIAGDNWGEITSSYTTGRISGRRNVGGIAGWNEGVITKSYSTCRTHASQSTVGGLVGGFWKGSITESYSTGTVSGEGSVGGLVGSDLDGGFSTITNCYSAGRILGTDHSVGGLVGFGYRSVVVNCFWNMDTSGQIRNTGGTGKTTAEMQTAATFLEAGWDFVDETENGTEDIWKISEGMGYPRLWWEKYSGVTGESNDPYQIATADDLMLLGESPEDYDKHFILTADIDLDPNLPGNKVFDRAVISHFTGVFDGNGYVISNLTIRGGNSLGLFGILDSGGKIFNLGLVAVDVNGEAGIGALVGTNNGSISTIFCTGVIKGDLEVGGLAGASVGLGSITDSHSNCEVSGSEEVGGLVGLNVNGGSITASSSTGTITGNKYIGGLAGINESSITTSYSTGKVKGNEYLGGLVGWSYGVITTSYSNATVRSTATVSPEGSSWMGGTGGLVGSNGGSISMSYNTGSVNGGPNVGGLVGSNPGLGNITTSYSTGPVSGVENFGGLVGYSWQESTITSSFWNVETSGQMSSAGGTGLNTAEMQTASTFLEVGWDFVGETYNGTEDIWKISEGMDYPRLWWEKYGGGTGEPNNPYLFYTAEHLNEMSNEPNDWDKHFKLMSDIDMSGYSYDKAVIAPHIGNQDLFKGTPFTGVFDGNGHTISHLTIDGGSLFGLLESGAEVRNLGILDVNIIGSGSEVGGLVAKNQGHVVNCYSTGSVSGDWSVGGLVGNNDGDITNCYSISKVIGNNVVGGLVGINNGVVIHCYSNNTVNGVWLVGGLIGSSSKMDVASCFWNIEISGQTTSAGGTGKTTIEMQTSKTFLEAGWDFVNETENGTEDIWWIDEGNGYPRLWWELIH